MGALSWFRFTGLLCWALSCVGCLISPPEPLEEREQEPPRVLVDTATPSAFAYVLTTSNGPQDEFRVEFTSVDLGETVFAKLYLNLDAEGERQIGSAAVSLAEDGNTKIARVTWDFDRDRPAGCYLVTMAITHQSNFSEGIPSKPIDPSRAAYITWWAAHDSPPEVVTFDDCPAPLPEPVAQENGTTQ